MDAIDGKSFGRKILEERDHLQDVDVDGGLYHNLS
jgi:hypothetical protein